MVFSTLEQRPTFWLFALGGALTSFVSYAHGQFFTPFFLRNHAHELTVLAGQFGMAPATGKPPLGLISLALGLGAEIGGAFGSWLGGVLADRWGAKEVRNYALFPLLVPFISLPVLWFAAGTDNVMLALILLLIPNIGPGAWWGPVYGGVQGLVPPAMRTLSATVLLFVINMIGLGGGPTAFGMTTDMMMNHYLAGTGLDVQGCKTAIDAAKAACASASAHGFKITVYLSTAIIPLAMLCFFLSRGTIKQDVANAEALPAGSMSTERLLIYLFVAGALPGAALANASVMLFHKPPPLFWLEGLLIGGLIGVFLAFMIARAGRRAAPSSRSSATGLTGLSGPMPPALSITLRPACREDLATVVRLLADDGLRAGREVVSEPPLPCYFEAFDKIAANSRNLLAVAEDATGAVIGTLQMTFIPGLANQGAELPLVSAVRVDSSLRGQRLGETMMAWAMDEARSRGRRHSELFTHLSRVVA